MFGLENNQLLPFERNRFYVGKLLTTADFVAEQNYFNNKRRFVNNLMFGSGILCGLGVYSLDDVSIMVDSGAAIDAMGREIVVENSVVKKLSAIDGYESITGDRAALCLRYAEKPIYPVYSVSRQEQGDEYELNRIREEWQLFLTDTALIENEPKIETEFFSKACFFQDADYAVDVMLPAAVSCGSSVKLTVCVEKLSEAEKSISLCTTFQTPAFTYKSGEHELLVELKDILLGKGESMCSDFWLDAQAKASEDSIIIAKPSLTKITVGDAEKRLEDNFILKVAVSDISINELIAREIARTSLEMKNLYSASDYIPLAEFTLHFTKNTYIIDKVFEQGVKKYINTNAGEELRQEYMSYFNGGKPSSEGGALSPREQGDKAGLSFQEPQYATGICEIPLGDKTRKGSIVFSDEIMHGLGKGNIYVDVGFEFITDDKRKGGAEKQTIYGDPELFGTDEPPISYVGTSVKVFNDRGSFIIAAKLLRETSFVLLMLRWVAVKFPSPADQSAYQRMAGKSISAVPPTVTLTTRESHYFNVRFKDMEPCTLTYMLTEKDSGEITSDGIYTAPAREGVFEILISCADMPLISTYAYAIVKKKENDSEAEDNHNQKKV